MRTSLFLVLVALPLVGCVDDITFGTTGAGGGGTGAGSDTGGSGTGAAATTSSTSTIATTATGGPECTGGTCVPNAPAGWTGPISLSATADCGGRLPPTLVLSSFAMATGTCPCALSGPPPCVTPSTTLYGTASCTNMKGTKAADLTCTTTLFGQGIDSATGATAVVPNPGTSCVSSGPVPSPNLVAPNAVCETNLGACSNGDACLADLAGSTSCVYSMDKPSCADAGPYSATRALTITSASCTCGDVQADCGGTTQLFQGMVCNPLDLQATVAHPSATCTTTGGSIGSMKFIPTDPALFAGECAQPSPDLSITSLQVCCLP